MFDIELPDGEPERPPGARNVRPALHVWIDVPKLLRRPAGHQAHTQPGIATGYRMPGVILQWAPTSDGSWLGARVRGVYLTGVQREAGPRDDHRPDRRGQVGRRVGGGVGGWRSAGHAAPAVVSAAGASSALSRVRCSLPGRGRIEGADCHPGNRALRGSRGS